MIAPQKPVLRLVSMMQSRIPKLEGKIMSTRATYLFNTTSQHQRLAHSPICFYIHHDGYPTGAMQYFYNAIKSENRRGSFADHFHRANDRSEFTLSHNAHGDTEYRYTAREDKESITIKCDERQNFSDVWKTIFDGPLDEYINHYRLECHKELTRYYRSSDDPNGEKYLQQSLTEIPTRVFRFKGRYMSISMLENQIEEKLKDHEEYIRRHPKAQGNIRYQVSEIDEALNKLALVLKEDGYEV